MSARYDVTLELVRSDRGDGGWSIHVRRPDVDEEEDPIDAWPLVTSGESEALDDGTWARPTEDDWVAARERAADLVTGWQRVEVTS